MYILDNFVSTPTLGEAQLRIKDSLGFVTRVIKKNTVANTSVINNSVIISFVASTSTFVLDFATDSDAKSALIKFNSFYSKISANQNTNYDEVTSVGGVRYTDLRTELGSMAVYSLTSNTTPLLYIYPQNIISQERDGNIVKLIDNSAGKVELTFYSLFDAKQGFSRINWLRQDPSRTLSYSYPSPDNTPPIAIWKNTRTFQNLEYITPNDTANRSEIINYYIVAVSDSRDGNIPINNNEFVTITDENNNSVGEILVSSNMVYTFTLTVYDAAFNLLQETFNFKVVDTLPDTIVPTIIYRTGLTTPAYLTGPIGSSLVPYNPFTPILNIDSSPFFGMSPPSQITGLDLVSTINSEAIWGIIDYPNINLGGITTGNLIVYPSNSINTNISGITTIGTTGYYRSDISFSDPSGNITGTTIYLNIY